MGQPPGQRPGLAAGAPDARHPRATLQTELLDRSTCPTREGLAQAVFAFIEGFYNPNRRNSTLGYLSPADYERQHLAGRLTETAA